LIDFYLILIVPRETYLCPCLSIVPRETILLKVYLLVLNLILIFKR